MFAACTIPWAQLGGIAAYRSTLARLAATWPIETIVPGHGTLTGGSTVNLSLRYFDALTATAARAVADGASRDSLVAGADVPVQFAITPPLAR